ncbi:hypothetical protein EV640_11421 [Nesterenkonia aurantiaca]|uniref:Transcriptional regulator, AbiEi antitoxin, Type IV TA system n=1 Tax=Nesterenkonia aurantiaca TaxID=1436010 RepID=A0A4R7FVD1_9MICC|nr:hypothetical protein EV640_11421 [Nesterenkonia aurantiaca]
MEQPTAPITLVQAALEAGGLHTGTVLSREVSRGTRLRVRPGVYAESQAWSEALPSERYLASLAAAAMTGSSGAFCRESALALHGLPLLRVPAAVHRRTLHRSQVGVHRSPGRLSYPTRFHEPPLPRGVTRAQMRLALGAENSVAEPGDPSWTPTALRGIASQLVTPECLRGFAADPVGLTVPVEPLPLALLDTVPRMPFEQAVVVLDAALARISERGLTLDELLQPWQPFLRGARLRAEWARAVDFADPRSESVGESLSRVRISELGFAVPELQSVVRVEGREYRLDFEWEGGVVGEFDGKQKYLRSQELFGRSAEEAVYREKLREDAIRSTGRRVVRWSWDDLHHPNILRDRLTRFGVPRA